MLSVIIPFKTDNGQRQVVYEWIARRYNALFGGCEIIVASDDSQPFSRSLARNNGAKMARNEFFLFADADTVPIPNAINRAVGMDVSWVLPYNRYHNVGEQKTREILRSAPGADVPEPSPGDCDHYAIESWAGMVLVKRDAFFEVGGYDECFQGWGYEDNAFALALTALVGKPQRVDAPCLHLWHPVSEGSSFTNPLIEQNRALFGEYKRASVKRERMREFLRGHLHVQES